MRRYNSLQLFLMSMQRRVEELQKLKIHKDQRGYILGLVMVFFVVFSITGLAFLEMARFEWTAASKNYDKVQAFYNAEGGLHKSLWLASKVSAAAASFSDSTVTVTFDSVGLTVKSIGSSGTVQDSIQITLRKTTNGTSGGTDLLMVVRNPGSLTTEESNIKSLIESWGYTVSTIDEDDTQTNFDAAFASNDVVYISEEVDASKVGAKVRDATIGVVNEEVNLVDEFGISGSFAFPTWTTNVNITKTVTTLLLLSAPGCSPFLRLRSRLPISAITPVTRLPVYKFSVNMRARNRR